MMGNNTAMKFFVSILLIAHSVCVLLYAVCGGLYYVSRIYGPSLELHGLNEKYGLGNCGPTTDFLDDLIIHENITNQEALKLAEKHGSAIVPSVLTKETSSSFRDYVMDANKKLESAYVTEPDNRHRITPPHTEPVVQQAFQEISQHPILRPLLDALLGPRASLIAFSVITSTYGAKQQGFHADTGSSSAKYPHLFVPEYTVAIALQDISTKHMGSTSICPGTHLCEKPDYDYAAMEQLFFENETLMIEYDGSLSAYFHHNVPCKVHATLQQGDALIYNTDTWHRGSAHTDLNAPDRAVLFVSFAASRQGPNDNRTLPFGKVYSLDWKMWGQTINDMETIQERPWRVWHSFGLLNDKKDNIRPWTLIDAFFQIYREEQAIAHFISNDFTAEHMSHVANFMVMGLICVGGVHVATSLPVGLFFVWYLWNRPGDSTKGCCCACEKNTTRPRDESCTSRKKMEIPKPDSS